MAVEITDEDAAPVKNGQWRRRNGLLIGVGLLALCGVVLWFVRTPIAENLVDDQLRQRDVAAKYRIESIGPRTQRLVDVVIGDPLRPDLIARFVELDLRWTWSGPEVAAIRADGVRLSGRWADGRFLLGEVDKLLPPPSDAPFAFPDIDLTLTDARARIATPWGDFGARIDGAGPLRDDFRGTVALVAERVLGAGCRSGRTTAYGELQILSGKPRFVGPVRSAGLGCATQQLRVARADANVDAELSSDFTRWRGQVDLSASALSTTSARLAVLDAKGEFSGAAAKTDLRFEATGRQLVAADLNVRDVAADGEARFGSGPLALSAKVRAAGAALSVAQQSRLVAFGDGASDDLIGPIAVRYGRALQSAAKSFGGEAELSLTGDERTRRIEIAAPTLRSDSGAVLRAEPGSRIAILLGGKQLMALVDGNWTLAGGGLPAARMAINRRTDGSVRGKLVLEPLVAGASRLALAPVTISGDRSGRLQLKSRAVLSGNVKGGRFDGLGVSIDAMVSPTGAVVLASGCQQVSFASASLAGVRLGPNQIRLCSAGRQPLLAYDRRGLAGELLFPSPMLRGFSAQNLLIARAQQARYTLASGQWQVDALDVQLGQDEAISRFAATTITGLTDASGINGRIEGASGSLSAVPLDLSEIVGDWRWADGQLTANAALAVNDRQTDRRFATLVSKDASLVLADSKIIAGASLAERETGVAVVRTEMRHDLNTAIGSADLFVNALRFNNRFQPDQLSPLALGVIAYTRGGVEGRGRIDWADAKVTSSGTFTTAGSDFAAAFGSVRGASTTIIFDDLLGVHTPPGQRISFDEINPGFPVIGGMIDYQLLGSTNIRIEGGRWPFAGGELILKPTTLDFDVNATRLLEFELKGVDAAVFLAEFGFENINASGVFDGVLPVEFSGLGGRIVGGRLVARSGGGQVAYVGELTNYNLGTMANFAFNMLKSLRYEAMEISLNGDLDGEMLTDVKITGLSQGKGASRNIITRQLEKLPIEFNVRIDAPFRQLITSAKSLYDPSVLGNDSLFSLIESRRAAGEQPVQPRVSEGVPK